MTTPLPAPAGLLLALALFLGACTPGGQPMPQVISIAELSRLLGGELLERDATSGEEEFLLTEDGHSRAVALRLFVPLEPDRAAVLTRSQEIHDSGEGLERDNSHASGGEVDLTYLRWQGRRWVVVERYAAAMELGSSGEFGRVESLDLARGLEDSPALKAVLIHSGGSWQGLSMDSVELVPLDGKPPRSILSQPVASDNQGACDAEQDCWSATSTLKLLPAQPGKGMAAIRIEQTLETAPSPLKQPAFLELSAEDREALRSRYDSPAAPPREQTTTRGTMVFEWDGKRYVLRSGKNIVPAI